MADQAARVVGMLVSEVGTSERKAVIVCMLERMDVSAVVAAGGAAALAAVITCPGSDVPLRRAALRALVRAFKDVAVAAQASCGSAIAALASVALGECGLESEEREQAGIALVGAATSCVESGGGGAVRAALAAQPRALGLIVGHEDDLLACLSLMCFCTRDMSAAEEQAAIDAGAVQTLIRVLDSDAADPERVQDAASLVAGVFSFETCGQLMGEAMLEAGTFPAMANALRRSATAHPARLGTVDRLIQSLAAAIRSRPALKAAVAACTVPVIRSMLEDDALMTEMVQRHILNLITLGVKLGDFAWLRRHIERPVHRLLRKNACGRCDSTTTPHAGSRFKICARCHAARYCSSRCQKAHWKEHKDLCTFVSSAFAPK